MIALGNVGEGGVMGAVERRASPFKCDVIQYNKINSPRVYNPPSQRTNELYCGSQAPIPEQNTVP
jgi:hypothetical protein